MQSLRFHQHGTPERTIVGQELAIPAKTFPTQHGTGATEHIQRNVK
jgi:hypothetical protein